MNSHLSIDNITFWEQRLGLLPIPLFHKPTPKKQYILLNGTHGNFCLDFENTFSEFENRQFAWSSDVDHYLNIIDNEVRVLRWDKYRSEKYRIKSVEDKIEDFYKYLTNDKTTEESIISFVIQIFRKIRALLRDPSGYDTLNVFLYLLACFNDKTDRNNVNTSKWNLSNDAKSILDNIGHDDWHFLYSEFEKGLLTSGLKPDISLLLRHASGNLFQEAHFEILFSKQYQLNMFLSSSLPKHKTNSYSSVHYTPTSLVRTVVEESIRALGELPNNITVFDPACGSGEFLKEFLRQLKVRDYHGNIKLIGWDVSPTAVTMTKFILAFEKINWRDNVKYEVICQNALSEEVSWPKEVDIVLMNPPFTSWELMNQKDRYLVQNILGVLFKKKPNSAAAFLWKAFACVKWGGILGNILPSSIFDAYSYNPLRAELSGLLSIVLIGKLGTHIFPDALVDTSIFIAKKSKKDSSNIPLSLWCDYKLESSSIALRTLRKYRSEETNLPVTSEGYSIYPNYSLGTSGNWVPMPFKSCEILEKLDDMPKVGDLFEVKQGVRTGLNIAFLVDKEYWKTLGKKEKIYFRPAITNEAIKRGYLTDGTYVFYPYEKNILKINKEEELKKVVPKYYKDILKPNYKKLVERSRISKQNWWKLSEHCAWQSDSNPKIVSTEFGTAGHFAYDSTGKYIVERGYAWLPQYKGKFYQDIEEISYAYIAVLSMSIINDLLNAVSKQIGGGQWYLSSQYILNMPLPNLFGKDIDSQVFQNLRDIGVCLSKNEPIDDEYLNSLYTYIFNDFQR